MITKEKAPSETTNGASEFEAGRRSTTPDIIADKSSPVMAPIPFGYEPTGPYCKQQALILYFLLRWTAATEERREWGFFIGVHSETWRNLIGSRYAKAMEQLKACLLYTSDAADE